MEQLLHEGSVKPGCQAGRGHSLGQYTKQVMALELCRRPWRDGKGPGRRRRHGPSRSVGEPSVFEACRYVIRNRTYDQVFGDMRQGNGNLAGAYSDRSVTAQSSRHRDQLSCSTTSMNGVLSADGHQFATEGRPPTGIANYLRRVDAPLIRQRNDPLDSSQRLS